MSPWSAFSVVFVRPWSSRREPTECRDYSRQTSRRPLEGPVADVEARLRHTLGILMPCQRIFEGADMAGRTKPGFGPSAAAYAKRTGPQLGAAKKSYGSRTWDRDRRSGRGRIARTCSPRPSYLTTPSWRSRRTLAAGRTQTGT